MEIKVIAIAPNDGWAFIIKEDNMFLMRPPYTSNHMIEATQKTVQNALHMHGFEVCEQSFVSWKEVIDFLKNKYVEAIKSRGIDFPSEDELGEILKYATDDVLLRFLDRAEKELIPDGKCKAARSIALDILDIMELEKARSNPEIHSMALSVLKKCNQEEKEMEKLLQRTGDQQETLGDKFTDAVNKYSKASIVKLMESIRKRGQILHIGV